MNEEIKKEILLKSALYPDTSEIEVSILPIEWDGTIESLQLWYRENKENNNIRLDAREIVRLISIGDVFDQLYSTNVNGILIEDGLTALLYFRKKENIKNTDTITIDMSEIEHTIEIVEKVEYKMNKKMWKWMLISSISSVLIFSWWKNDKIK